MTEDDRSIKMQEIFCVVMAKPHPNSIWYGVDIKYFSNLVVFCEGIWQQQYFTPQFTEGNNISTTQLRFGEMLNKENFVANPISISMSLSQDMVDGL